jgi:hypothetical protein
MGLYIIAGSLIGLGISPLVVQAIYKVKYIIKGKSRWERLADKED